MSIVLLTLIYAAPKLYIEREREIKVALDSPPELLPLKVFLSDNVDPDQGVQKEHHNHQLIRLKQLSVQERERDRDRNNISMVTRPINLKIEIPCSNVGSDPSKDGFNTPTSSASRILECPGAPKKIKSRPAMKRKACRRIVLDVSKQLQSLFPMVDLAGIGMDKRLKQCSVTDS
ncbi:hypothetical protein VNO78_14241 [Psophocarpus tetragonolobus]|uniref:Uncharacterized protein n=1 Tax=Psophocarpus tetragonolobus TaxID=3891 RepID=A0AAN9SSX6_PSOTE